MLRKKGWAAHLGPHNNKFTQAQHQVHLSKSSFPSICLVADCLEDMGHKTLHVFHGVETRGNFGQVNCATDGKGMHFAE